jgi:hypothetical protein
MKISPELCIKPAIPKEKASHVVLLTDPSAQSRGHFHQPGYTTICGAMNIMYHGACPAFLCERIVYNGRAQRFASNERTGGFSNQI